MMLPVAVTGLDAPTTTTGEDLVTTTLIVLRFLRIGVDS
jgi:hypothetical protein